MLTSPASLGTQAKAPASSLSPARIGHLRQQAEDLEGVFLNTLMKEMFSSLKSDQSAMGGGFGEETWRGMQAEQMADAMARAGGIGIAEAILPDLIAVQEAAQNNPSIPGAMR
ncbi:rod-binding protein [Devosia sp.]|uniref:rod-binding protein n=1 Tax=Devosia sp. TaxID=1871048 RepID=UPI001AC5D834|nr:rod-binding protein [Devosia sp.]MBN9310381.1 rod-binding protein [Devosia sp.]